MHAAVVAVISAKTEPEEESGRVNTFCHKKQKKTKTNLNASRTIVRTSVRYTFLTEIRTVRVLQESYESKNAILRNDRRSQSLKKNR